MSTNCLVTKLKASVENGNLERLGMWKLHLDAGETVVGDTDRSQLTFYGPSGTTVKFLLDNITGDCHFTDNAGTADYGTQRSVNFNSSGFINIFISKGSCDLFLSKYDLKGFNIAADYNLSDRIVFDIDSLEFSEELGSANIITGSSVITAQSAVKMATGDVSNIKGTGLSRLVINRTGFVGDLTPIIDRNHATLTELAAYITNTEIDYSVLELHDYSAITVFLIPRGVKNGDIAHFGRLNINLPYADYNVADKFYGTLESYAAKRASLYGAGSSTTALLKTYANVTYQGTKLSELGLGSSTTFTWDASGNITSFE